MGRRGEAARRPHGQPPEQVPEKPPPGAKPPGHQAADFELPAQGLQPLEDCVLVHIWVHGNPPLTVILVTWVSITDVRRIVVILKSNESPWSARRESRPRPGVRQYSRPSGRPGGVRRPRHAQSLAVGQGNPREREEAQ